MTTAIVKALPAAPATNVDAPMSFSLGATAAIALAAIVLGVIGAKMLSGGAAEGAAEEEEETRPRRRRKRRRS